MKNASLIIDVDFPRKIIYIRSFADNYLFLIDERQLFWSNRFLKPRKIRIATIHFFLNVAFFKTLCTLNTEMNNSN